MEWREPYDEPEPGHRHMSHLYGLHPGNQISPMRTPDLAKAARKVLDYRLSHGGGHTGWSRAWMINFGARLCDGDECQQEEQASDETALALRADASRLLQAVHGVEEAMATATGDVKEALARGLADLGAQFDEFRWMLAGVRDTLAEMRARQALQLALQREQLDLQRQQLVKTNLLLHRQRGAARDELG